MNISKQAKVTTYDRRYADVLYTIFTCTLYAKLAPDGMLVDTDRNAHGTTSDEPEPQTGDYSKWVHIGEGIYRKAANAVVVDAMSKERVRLERKVCQAQCCLDEFNRLQQLVDKGVI